MYRVLSDGTLMGLTKRQLIKQLRIAEHNWMAANANLNQQYENVKDWRPVVRGRWVDNMCRDWRCSECSEKIHKVRNVDGYCYDDKPNYCPNCGAKMDKDGDE